MHYLKADTASRVVLGPFVDEADGYTMISTAAITAADTAIALKYDPSNGYSSVALTGTITQIVDGYYWYSIPATTLNEEGWMRIAIEDADLFLPVWEDFMVVNANVYDALFASAATAYLKTDLTQVLTDGTSATDLKDMVDTGYNPTSNLINANVSSINSVTAAAINLEQMMSNAIPATCDDTGDAQTVKTSLSGTYTTTDQFKGRIFIFDLDTSPTTALRGQAGVITSYNGTNGDLGFAASTFTNNSVSGDTGIIL